MIQPNLELQFLDEPVLFRDLSALVLQYLTLGGVPVLEPRHLPLVPRLPTILLQQREELIIVSR